MFFYVDAAAGNAAIDVVLLQSNRTQILEYREENRRHRFRDIVENPEKTPAMPNANTKKHTLQSRLSQFFIFSV